MANLTVPIVVNWNDIKDQLAKGNIVEVVRCKDCKHWNGETHGCNRNPCIEPWWETDFCNYGERMDGGENG